MNTEDRLRHASEEIERATASLTAPPINGVRRSARLRTVGVAVGAALGAMVLVGGVVLAFGSGGETTLAPAGPSETTAPTAQTTAVPAEVDGMIITVPMLGPEPEFDLGSGAVELPFATVGAVSFDATRVHRLVSNDYEARTDEVIVLGAGEGHRGYVLIGEYRSLDQVTAQGSFTRCTVLTSVNSARYGCGPGAGDVLDAFVDTTEGGLVFSVGGTVAEEASVVALDVDDARVWTRIRDGYVFLAADGLVDSAVGYVVYDPQGNVLIEKVFYNGEGGDEQSATTIARAVEAAGSCSGGRFFPSSDPEMDLGEPVFQTRSEILLFASRCWFDELADVAGDNFTASFGGSDPAELWASQEENGGEPMHALLRILDMSYRTVETGSGLMYIWPAAAAHDGDWDTVPEADKEALRPLYDEDDFALFSDFGGYIGYRLGITEDGDWSFFVAGD